MKHKKLGSIVLTILVAVTFSVPSAKAALTQRINYFIDGDCRDYFDVNGEYAFFQEEQDWSCFLTVSVKPAKPIRNAKLQYWNGRKWLLESSSKTSSTGYATLKFDPICESGDYCDGTWKYRVYVDAAPGQRSQNSITFDVTFYSGTVEDPGYDDSEEEMSDDDY